MMPQLAFYILEGLTPNEHEVKIIEEEIELTGHSGVLSEEFYISR